MEKRNASDGGRADLLDAIEREAAKCRGGSCGNPRYFAEMFAGCLSANGYDERTALECLLDAVRECARRQAVDEAKGWALAAVRELERLR